jgi:hypothetical protein
MRVKWNVHLDLSTDSTQYRAYIYSHPTVVDLDRDGYMEILVGTSEGFLYCLSHVGELSNLVSHSGDHILSRIPYDGRMIAYPEFLIVIHPLYKRVEMFG